MPSLLQAGLNVTAIGLGVVFTLLTALVFIIKGMSALSRRLEAAFGTAPAAEPAPAASLRQQELVSVISAAIAAYRKRR